MSYLAPAAGFEPATSKLTASCSTIELRRNTPRIIAITIEVVKNKLLATESFYLLGELGNICPATAVGHNCQHIGTTWAINDGGIVE